MTHSIEKGLSHKRPVQEACTGYNWFGTRAHFLFFGQTEGGCGRELKWAAPSHTKSLSKLTLTFVTNIKCSHSLFFGRSPRDVLFRNCFPEHPTEWPAIYMTHSIEKGLSHKRPVQEACTGYNWFGTRAHFLFFVQTDKRICVRHWCLFHVPLPRRNCKRGIELCNQNFGYCCAPDRSQHG